jgi:hypothetical protein
MGSTLGLQANEESFDSALLFTSFKLFGFRLSHT